MYGYSKLVSVLDMPPPNVQVVLFALFQPADNVDSSCGFFF